MRVPEAILDRFFRSDDRTTEERKDYRGKLDLEQVGDVLRQTLYDLQRVFNEGLLEQHGRLLDETPRVHFDYVDSSIANALAFRYEDVRFIGITLPLIERLLHGCQRLSDSPVVASEMGITLTPEQRQDFLGYLFNISLSFVVNHEYAHHRLGQVVEIRDCKAFWVEFAAHEGNGSLGQQVREIHADGFGTFLTIHNLFFGNGRPGLFEVFGPVRDERHADALLLAAFVLGVSNFFFTRQPEQFDPVGLYALQHPPPAARMGYIMTNVQRWSEKNRPLLLADISVDFYQIIMRAGEEAIWGAQGRQDWHEQTTFLFSEAGAAYFDQLRGLLAIPQDQPGPLV